MPPRFDNRQHSVWMGATLRYLYLTVAPPATFNLKNWVTNNRGHLLRVGVRNPGNLSADVIGVERT